MKMRQINFRMENPEIEEKLRELKEMGYSQTASMKLGILTFYEYAKTNPSAAAMLALKV